MSNKLEPPERAKQIAQTLLPLFHAQRLLIVDFSLDDRSGRPNAKALGYLFGFTDSALQTAGLDIRNAEGHATFLNILHGLAPGKAGEYITFLQQSMTTDTSIMNGMMLGGGEYRNWYNSKGATMPLGWRRCFSPAADVAF